VLLYRKLSCSKRNSQPTVKIEQVDVLLIEPFNFNEPLVEPFKSNKALPIIPFKSHFPIDVFRIIVDMYVYDCRLDGDLRGISRLMRSSPLLYHWLGPDVYRFVTLSSFDSITSFCLSLRTARKYTQAIDVTSEVAPVQTSASMRSTILRLEGRLERLCLPHNYVIPFSTLGGSVFVRDVTLLYNYRTIPGDIQCKRLRLALSYADIEHEAAPLVTHLPSNSPLWISLHHQVTSFAFELSSDDFDTLNTVYEIYLNLRFTILQQCVAIIYFRSRARLEETRKHGRMFRNSTNANLHLVFLLLEEHNDWTFGALEWQGEDFWEKIQTRFEAV
jgi:hypothetical protein